MPAAETGSSARLVVTAPRVNPAADSFRQAGTEKSPGTMLFTVIGDVDNPGVSSPVPSPERLATPLTDEDDMHTAGTGLGSGGFVVYDHSHCIVRVALQLSHFLAIESCAQCTACKLGCTAITAARDEGATPVR